MTTWSVAMGWKDSLAKWDECEDGDGIMIEYSQNKQMKNQHKLQSK